MNFLLVWTSFFYKTIDFFYREISERSELDDSTEMLDCGKVVNFTYYDDLIGVADRYNHPLVPEPEVFFFLFAFYFR